VCLCKFALLICCTVTQKYSSGFRGRELFEETGLRTTGWAEPFALWESCYPTTKQACVDAGGVQAHHLVLYMQALVDSSSVLKLQPSETDAAVWLPMAQLGSLISPGLGPETTRITVMGVSFSAKSGRLESTEFPLTELAGIYPDAMGRGVAQGHLFALGQFLASHTS
jgi:hypothetical protein